MLASTASTVAARALARPGTCARRVSSACARPRPSIARERVVAARAEVDDVAQKSATDDDVPVWERREIERKAAAERGGLPWPTYLLGSVIVLIAATGSVFEYAYGHAVFGVVTKESPLYAPILGWFVVTGFPLAGWLWMKGIAGANEASELQDKIDGY